MQRDFEFVPDPSAGKTEAPTAVARLLRCGGGSIALPAHTTLEIVDHPKAVPVPGAARHAIGLLEWQGRRIALIDAAVLLESAPQRTQAPRYALVVAMQASAGSVVVHGAIALDVLPESIAIGDDAACALPVASCPAAISCFTHEGAAIPVIDTARLFSA